MRQNSWTKKEIRLLKKHYPTMPTGELSSLLGRSTPAIRTMAQREGIIKRIASNNPYTPEKLRLLKKLYPNTKNVDIAKILGVTESSVIGAGFRYRLRKTKEFMRLHSEKGMFKEGNPPKNKGKKWKEYMSREGMRNARRTQFKKGTVPPNWKPAGSERIDVEGYIWIKPANHQKFMLKHRYVWQQHFGKIPKGKNVEFKDRNRHNCDPSNLVLRSREESMKLNSYHNYPKEIASAIQLLGALNRQINKKNKTA
jgi:hypothetical protein